MIERRMRNGHLIREEKNYYASKLEQKRMK